MIPKIIHYCWFGGNPLPNSAKKCIDSWKKFFPDYEIIEWNESNYDVRKIPYIAQAYDASKYAFVSDYARFDILYQYGGVYFDTDVEVIKAFDDILANGAFMGCEIDGVDSDEEDCVHADIANNICINPGLGIAAPSGQHLYKEILEYYKTQNFLLENGSINTETVVLKTTRIFMQHGLNNIKGIQRIADITIYPKEYFNPKDSSTGKLELTKNTHSIHWYSMSWMSSGLRIRSSITRIFHRLFGVNCFDFLKRHGTVKERSKNEH